MTQSLHQSTAAQKPIVACDADGVLVDFLAGALTAIRLVSGKFIAPHQIKQWDPWKQLQLTEQETKCVKDIICMPGFVRNLLPCEGAKSGIKAVSEIADVYVVTSPWISSDTWVSERYAWLEEVLGVKPGRVIHTSAKHLIKADFFIDDKPENVRDYRANGGRGGYLWNASYNAQATDLPRLHGWDALIELVKGPQQ